MSHGGGGGRRGGAGGAAGQRLPAPPHRLRRRGARGWRRRPPRRRPPALRHAAARPSRRRAQTARVGPPAGNPRDRDGGGGGAGAGAAVPGTLRAPAGPCDTPGRAIYIELCYIYQAVLYIWSCAILGRVEPGCILGRVIYRAGLCCATPCYTAPGCDLLYPTRLCHAVLYTMPCAIPCYS